MPLPSKFPESNGHAQGRRAWLRRGSLALAIVFFLAASPVPAQQGGTIEGGVRLTGEPPRNRLIPMGADPSPAAGGPAPYTDLTPGGVLDALDAVGLQGDGRLIQLNSYENRVFQVFLEGGRVVVAKFYRPGRWSDAQILEEHAFAIELAQAEIPVVAPLAFEGRTLHASEGFRFAVSVNDEQPTRVLALLGMTDRPRRVSGSDLPRG